MNKIGDECMPDTVDKTAAFVTEAQASGAAVLAHWPDLHGWHYAVWVAPPGKLAHWCKEGRWTPGPDPDAFMPMPAEPAPVESSEDVKAERLLAALGLNYRQANVGIGRNEWFVTIYNRQKKPTLSEWMGWPVTYRIGGGIPRAY